MNHVENKPGRVDTYPELARFTVCTASPETVEVDICLDQDAALLRDHFPTFPVVPGVLQLRWAFQFAEQLYDGTPTGPFGVSGYRIANLKFRAPMLSGPVYRLSLRRTTVGFRFKIVDGNRVISSGTVEYGD